MKIEFETKDGRKGILDESVLMLCGYDSCRFIKGCEQYLKCKDCLFNKTDEGAALCELMGCNDNDFIDSMVIITNELKRDKSPNSVYFGWQSNLACCIYDGLNDEYRDLTMSQCNELAIKFLNRLIGDN